MVCGDDVDDSAGAATTVRWKGWPGRCEVGQIHIGAEIFQQGLGQAEAEEAVVPGKAGVAAVVAIKTSEAEIVGHAPWGKTGDGGVESLPSLLAKRSG